MPYPGAGFPIPPFEWPHVGRQWPPYNIESDQADGLLAWWPFMDGTGTQEIIHGYDFTIKGTPSWVITRERGRAIYFDANTDWLDYSTALTPSPPFTMSCWVWLTGLTACTPMGMCAQWSTSTGYNFYVHSDGTVRFLANANSAQATKAITAGAWYHLCGVAHSSSSRAMFVEGANKGTNAVDVSPVVVRTTIGGLADQNDAVTYRPVLGYVSDVRFYNVAKTDTEAYQIATEPWELHQIPRRLWRLGVPTGVTVAMDTLGLTGAAQTMTQVSGAVSLTMDTLDLAGTAQALTQISGAVTLAMDALGLTGSAQALTVSVGAVSLAMDVLNLAGTAQGLTVTPGAVSLAMDALDLVGAAQGLTVTPGAVALAMDALGLTGSAQSLTVSAGIFIAMALLDLTGSAQGLTVVPGAVTIEMSELQAAVAALALAVLVVGGKLDVALVDAAVTLLVLSDAAATTLTTSDAAVTTLVLDDETRG